MTQIGDVKRCAFCAYEGEEPGFGEHVRAAHGFIPQADAPPVPDELYGIRAPTGPQLLAIGFVLLFVFGAVWVIEGYGFNWMPFGGGLDPLQMLGSRVLARRSVLPARGIREILRGADPALDGFRFR